MKKLEWLFPILLVSTLSGCAVPGGIQSRISPDAGAGTRASAPAPAPTLANPGFEDTDEGLGCPPRWWCTAHSDPTAYRFATTARSEGGRFLRIEQPRPREPYGAVSQAFPAAALAGRRVSLSADVDASRVRRGEGAGPFIRFYGPGGRIITADHALRRGGTPQARETVEKLVPPGCELMEVGVIIYGHGAADFDNVKLEIAPR